MKRRPIILLFVGFAVLALLGIFGVWRSHLRERSLELRIADVKTLLDAYGQFVQSNTVSPMPDLSSILKDKSISLHNPIAKDRSLPCYQVAPGAGSGESAPDAVVIEETDNVRDANLRVRGYADGSIRVERRQTK